MLKNVRPRIKEWIVKRDTSGKAVAEHLEISETQVSKWSKGKAYPRFEQLWKLSKFLGVKMDDLYEEIKKEGK